ncbi:MAG TPA: D-tyrosyl-tRNA(Tyr) deacylase [Firmicutes bacterium]|nr:D-tyrosyl-tRNA(Tyr) deacylase [Bacillota bacterium]
MRAVIQRASYGRVTVGGEVVGEIERGLVVLVGVGQGDGPGDAEYLAEKTAHLRIFPDDEGKMNLSALDVGAGVLAVSQFTLYGDCRKGRRPGFSEAASPDAAFALFCDYISRLRRLGLKVETGRFGASMLVEIHNDGPVTILLDSKRLF